MIYFKSRGISFFCPFFIHNEDFMTKYQF